MSDFPYIETIVCSVIVFVSGISVSVFRETKSERKRIFGSSSAFILAFAFTDENCVVHAV